MLGIGLAYGLNGGNFCPFIIFHPFLPRILGITILMLKAQNHFNLFLHFDLINKLIVFKGKKSKKYYINTVCLNFADQIRS